MGNQSLQKARQTQVSEYCGNEFGVKNSQHPQRVKTRMEELIRKAKIKAKQPWLVAIVGMNSTHTIHSE